MVHTDPVKILYISTKCVGKSPCYHFIELEDDNHEQYKVIMSSVQICDLCEKLKCVPSQHIKNNKNICYFQDKCIIL